MNSNYRHDVMFAETGETHGVIKAERRIKSITLQKRLPMRLSRYNEDLLNPMRISRNYPTEGGPRGNGKK